MPDHLQELRRELARETVDARAVHRRVDKALDADPLERRRYMKQKLRFTAVCIAAALALTGCAWAAVPALRQAILADLGSRAPYATDVSAVCEDQGIRIEARAALADSRITRLYFTIQDSEDRLMGEYASSDMILSLETGGTFSWGNGGTGLEVLSYDPEQHLATLVYSRGTDELSAEPPTRAKLDVTWFLPGERNPGLVMDGAEIPSAPLESTRAAGGRTVLAPRQTPLCLSEDTASDVSVSSMGFADDGLYHIRFRQSDAISPAGSSKNAENPIFQVRYYLYDPQQPDRWPTQAMEDVTCTAVEDGWDFCLPSLTEDTLPYLDTLILSADYSVSGGRLEGNWSLTVPVEAVESCAAEPAAEARFSYTHNGETPYGRTHDARLDRVTVSSLSVCADFSTPEGQDYPCQLSGAELPLAVTLADGSVLTPACSGEVWSQRVGWVVWEFETPVDPDSVVSVTLDGCEIPL